MYIYHSPVFVFSCSRQHNVLIDYTLFVVYSETHYPRYVTIMVRPAIFSKRLHMYIIDIHVYIGIQQ